MPAFRRDLLSPLTLGTVQLGMPYGVANPGGQPSKAAARAVLDTAWEGGITCLDTARAYGDAEARLGAWLARRPSRPLVISKLPPLPTDSEDIGRIVVGHLDRSLAALGIDSLDGWLVHRAADIARRDVANSLRKLQERGQIGAFGASVYAPEEALAALDVPGLSLIQAPASIFDRRFVRMGVTERCAEAGVTFFARSAFLQGAVFLDPDRLPAHLAPLARPLIRLRATAAEVGRSCGALALGYVRAQPRIDSVVIGAFNPAQVRENLAAAPLDPALLAALDDVAEGVPENVIDPRRWP